MDSDFIFEDQHPDANEGPRVVSKRSGSGQTHGTKRKKYTTKACHDCKRRKVKCSGEETCSHCRNRSVRCRYSPTPHDPERHSDGMHSTDGSAGNQNAPDKKPRNDFACMSVPVDQNVAVLCDRIISLERQVAHLLDTTKRPDCITHQSPIPFQRLIPSNEAAEEEEASLFAVGYSPTDDLSLSSQVAAIDALVTRPASPSHLKTVRSVKFEIMVELPDPPVLSHLLNMYFHEFDCYFPFVDRRATEPRIYSLIRKLGYNSCNRTLLVTTEGLPIIALACSMLALAACLDSDEDACDGETKPGWELYLQSCRAMNHIVNSKTIDLDAVQAQALIATYLMYSELLSAATRSLFLATQLAAAIRLNNQKAWPIEEVDKNIQRQQLWWTIYYLDRQIARKSGTVYHIRDIEFDVKDFRDQEESPNNNTEPQTVPSLLDSRAYMQALINLARLWGTVWDSFFAIGAKAKGDWMQIEIMDTQILNSRRQLSTDLTWETEKLGSYILDGNSETHIRRRLQLHTRLQLLRALIRHNPAWETQFNPEAAHFCSRIAREIITAHDKFISSYPAVRAIGYFTTACIVECIYHLVPVLYYSDGSDEYTACFESLSQAHGILVKLSAKTNVAKRALKAVGYAIKRWDASESSTIARGDQVNGISGKEICQDNTTEMSHLEPPPDCDLQIGTDLFGVDLGEWVSGPMGTLFNHDLEFISGSQF